MNLKEASDKYNIPVYRIRKAIDEGYVLAKKESSGKWDIDELSISKDVDGAVVIDQGCYSVHITNRANCKGKNQIVNFQTQGAAREFAELYRKHLNKTS